jgi:hypothetical protein
MADERDAVRKELESRREFRTHLVAYVVINVFLIGIWAITGAGYFWPVWVIGGWGIGLAFHAWNTYGGHDVTDADIDAELARRRRGSTDAGPGTS